MNLNIDFLRKYGVCEENTNWFMRTYGNQSVNIWVVIKKLKEEKDLPELIIWLFNLLNGVNI